MLSGVYLLFGGGGTDLDLLVRSYMEQQLAEYEYAEYEIVSVPKLLKNNNFEVNINYDRAFRLSKGHGYIPITVIDNMGSELSSYITVEVRIYQTVLVAQRNIGKGDMLNPGDFDYQRIEISHLFGEPVTDISSLSDSRAKANMRSGDILVERLIERKPVIFRNDNITAFSGMGNVFVEVPAKALQDGHIGANIRIETANNRIFIAKIINEQFVKIVE
jgi:flagella basal body P-ring formation protein FlgA